MLELLRFFQLRRFSIFSSPPMISAAFSVSSAECRLTPSLAARDYCRSSFIITATQSMPPDSYFSY